MQQDKITNEYIIYILKEMCSRVGADYDSIDFKKDRWYMEYEWDVDQENSFKEWLTNYLYENNTARQSITNMLSKSKKRIRKFAEMFNLNYGWKSKDPSTI